MRPLFTVSFWLLFAVFATAGPATNGPAASGTVAQYSIYEDSLCETLIETLTCTDADCYSESFEATIYSIGVDSSNRDCDWFLFSAAGFNGTIDFIPAQDVESGECLTISTGGPIGSQQLYCGIASALTVLVNDNL